MIEPLTPRADFPVFALPAWARSYAESVANVLQVDAAVVALSILGATAIAVQGKAEVHVRGGWSEQLAFWVLLILRSGNRKSPALFKPLRPLRRWEKEQNEARKEYRQVLDNQLAAFTKPEREANAAAYKLAEPPRLDLFASDATLEAIAIGLAEQNEAYAIVTDEPTSLANVIGGLYSDTGSPNTGILMAGYTGSPYRRRRVKSPEAWLERPALSLTLFGQPAIFDQLAASEHLIDLGFVGRLVIARPRDLLGERRVHADSMPANVDREYSENMGLILAAQFAHPFPDVRAKWVEDPPPWPQGPLDRHVLALDENARQLHLEIEQRIEPMLREGEALGDVTDFGGKLAGLIARSAGLVHVLENPGDWWERAVDADAMAWGGEIGRYALGQVLELYSQGARERRAESAAARALAKARKLASNGAIPPMITWRALSRALIHSNGRGLFRSTGDLREAVDTLVDSGRLIPDRTFNGGERWLLSEPDTEDADLDRAEKESLR